MVQKATEANIWLRKLKGRFFWKIHT